MITFIKNFDFKLFKKIWNTAIPLMLGGFISSAMTLMDSIFLANYSKYSFNAVILALPLIGIVIAMASAIGISLVDLLGKETKRSNHSIHVVATIILSSIATISVVVICVNFEDNIVSILRLNEEQLFQEKIFFLEYWKWIVPSFYFQIPFIITIQLLVFFNRTKFSNYVLLVISLLNVTLNFLLIIQLELGAKGAAIGTNISFIVGVFIIIATYNQHIYNKILKTPLKKMREMLFYSIKKQFLTSVVISLSISTFVIGNILINNLSAMYGTMSILVIGTTEQLKQLFFVPTRGVTAAYIIEFNVKLRTFSTADYFKTYWVSTLIIAFIYALGIICFLFLADPVITLFNFKNFQIISEQIRYSLFISAGVFFFSIFTRASQVGFLNLGYSYLLLLQSIITVIATYYFAKLLAFDSEVYGIINGQLLGAIIVFVIFFPLYIFLLHKRKKRDQTLAGML